jgi:ATP synthase F1 delta subunit
MESMELARMYARALMDYKKFYDKDPTWAYRLNMLASFFYQQRHLVWRLSQEIYQAILDVFGFDYGDFKALLELLEKHHRRILFADILQAMSKIYRSHHGYEISHVQSAQLLEDQQLSFLIQQLEKKIGKKLYYMQEVNPELIAGVRVQGESFVWEHSIAQQLRNLEQRLLRI